MVQCRTTTAAPIFGAHDRPENEMLFGVGLVEAYQLPRYGIEWLLGGIVATVILASFWIRSQWD
jgi:hypothetical protein